MIRKNTIGIDFGTDSVRLQIANAEEGKILANASSPYKRWGKGHFCQPGLSQFRQHPLDHIESFEEAMRDLLGQLDSHEIAAIKGISVASTGSTPIAVDAQGIPLSMTEGFKENPNACFFLWKDHSAIKEAAEINQHCHKEGSTDYTKYLGGEYSSEWFWAKLLFVLRNDPSMSDELYSWVEHCDWFTALLLGTGNSSEIKRSRCASGHKAMWHEEWGGLPPVDFFNGIDPRMGRVRMHMDQVTHSSGKPAGTLSEDWSQKFGLPKDIIVGIGSLDAHIGAIGGGIQEGWLVKVIGTSTCDMLVAPKASVHGAIEGICGQVDGSILPEMVGFEAGQSAFGDIYAWFGSLISWGTRHNLTSEDGLDANQKAQREDKISETLIAQLTIEAEKIQLSETGPLALDWMNGRRTPYSDQRLKGGIIGLHLGTTAPALFRSLVEATAFGSKAIIEHLKEQNIQIDGIIGIGGVAQKSDFVMQVLADVLDRPIKVVQADQPVALGAAMAAAVACNLHGSFESAQRAMGSGVKKEFTPIKENALTYAQLYERYKEFGRYVEQETTLE